MLCRWKQQFASQPLDGSASKRLLYAVPQDILTAFARIRIYGVHTGGVSYSAGGGGCPTNFQFSTINSTPVRVKGVYLSFLFRKSHADGLLVGCRKTSGAQLLMNFTFDPKSSKQHLHNLWPVISWFSKSCQTEFAFVSNSTIVTYVL